LYLVLKFQTMRSFSILISGLLMSVQAVFSQTSINMIVHEESKPCRRMMEQTCLQVQKNGSSEWELFYDPIKGFLFEEGYRYEIVVIQTERPEPVPQDLSRYIYKLDRIVSKTPATEVRTFSETGSAKMAPSEMWRVVSLNGIIQNGNDLIIDMAGDGMHISAWSGCSRSDGGVSYNKKHTKISVKELGGIQFRCGEEQMKLEKEFLNAISGKKFKISRENGQWIWKRKRKQILVMEPYEPKVIIDPVPMEERIAWDYFSGKNLKVIQLNGNSMPETKANLTFDAQNNHFSGSNGCNQVNGNFVSNGTAITFSKVASTKMKCNDQADIIEKKIMAILNSPGLTVDFADQVMNIYDASGALVLMLAIDGSK
jgi:heat shock protein HslJ